VYRGRVLDQEGKACPGCEAVHDAGMGLSPSPVAVARICHCGAGWPIHIPGPEMGVWRSEHRRRAAAANYGIEWVNYLGPREDGKSDIRLLKDDVPITVRSSISRGSQWWAPLFASYRFRRRPGDDLGPWLGSCQRKEGAKLPTGASLPEADTPSQCPCRSPRMPRAAFGSTASAAIDLSTLSSTGRLSPVSTSVS